MNSQKLWKTEFLKFDLQLEEMAANSVWNCPACTSANKLDSNSCALCGMTRSTDSKFHTSTNTQSKIHSNNSRTTQNQISDDGGDSHELGINISSPTTSRSSESLKARFERITLAIATDNINPLPVFNTLKMVCKKTLKDDARYRSLDLQNPKVVERLIGRAHVLDFLYQLGFKPKEQGTKLVCDDKPSVQVVNQACEVLNSFIHRYTAKIKSKLNSNINSSANTYNTGAITDEKKDGDSQDNNNSDNNNNMLTGVDNTSVIAQNGYGYTDYEDVENWSLEQVVAWCEHEKGQDVDSMETLIVTHKEYCKSIDLLNTFRNRYFVSAPEDIKNDKDKLNAWENNSRKQIRLTVINGLRDWLKEYWNEDFEDNNDNIKDELIKFINEIKIKTPDLPFGKLLEIEVKKYSSENINGGGTNININNINITPKLHPLAFDFDEIDWDSITYDKNDNYNIINDITPELIADQITLLDFDTLRRIKPRECINEAWKKKDSLKRAPHILKMIRRFNNFTKFCEIKILSENTVINRACQISKIIQIGRRLYELNNMNSLCAVFSSLYRGPVCRRKKEWAEVSPEDKQCFKEFKNIFDSAATHPQLRRLLRCMETPAIPHIGTFLQDMVFIQTGNRPIKTHFAMYPTIMDRIKRLQMFFKDGYQSFDNDDYDNKDEDQDKDEKELEGKRDGDIDTDEKKRRFNLKPDLKIMKMLMDEFKIMYQFTEDEIWNMRKLPSERNNGGAI